MFNAFRRVLGRKSIVSLSSRELESLTLRTKQNVSQRESELDFGLLGRSLSLHSFFSRIQEIPRDSISALEIRSDDELENFLRNFAQDSTQKTFIASMLLESQIPQCLLVNTILHQDLSLLSSARIYAPKIIIHADIIISTYQILESIIYGADMIVLMCEVLEDSSFKELHDYAARLGLAVCVLAKNQAHIQSAQKCGVRFFITQTSAANFITLSVM